jgi:hypothetical protein
MSGFANPSLAIVERNASLRFERRLPGCFGSHLVIDPQDAVWVMKADRPIPHEYGLINELLGWEFCHRLELPLSPYKLVGLPDTRAADGSSALLERRAKKRLCFLSRYVPDVERSRCTELLPAVWLSRVANRSACLGMFIFDVWADHRDKRQAIFAETGNGFTATFIDNTHLFGGVTRNDPYWRVRLSSVEIVALSAALEEGLIEYWIRTMRRALPAALDLTLSLLPLEWRETQMRDGGFQSKFSDRLQRLEDLVNLALDSAKESAPPFRSEYVCVLPESDAATMLPMV